MTHKIGDTVYVQDFTPAHKLCPGTITGLWELQDAPCKYVVHFIGSDGSKCGGTFEDGDLYDQAVKLDALPECKEFRAGDAVWFWYYDDGLYNVWFGNIQKILNTGEFVIGYKSYRDLEENENEPYNVDFTVKPNQVFWTRHEAEDAVTEEFRHEIVNYTDQELEDYDIDKYTFEHRNDITFDYEEGEHVYVVIPYASGALVELRAGVVETKPQSADPHWFMFKDDLDGKKIMAPTKFTAETEKDAAELYGECVRKGLLNDFYKRYAYADTDIETES